MGAQRTRAAGALLLLLASALGGAGCVELLDDIECTASEGCDPGQRCDPGTGRCVVGEGSGDGPLAPDLGAEDGGPSPGDSGRAADADLDARAPDVGADAAPDVSVDAAADSAPGMGGMGGDPGVGGAGGDPGVGGGMGGDPGVGGMGGDPGVGGMGGAGGAGGMGGEPGVGGMGGAPACADDLPGGVLDRVDGGWLSGTVPFDVRVRRQSGQTRAWWLADGVLTTTTTRDGFESTTPAATVVDSASGVVAFEVVRVGEDIRYFWRDGQRWWTAVGDGESVTGTRPAEGLDGVNRLALRLTARGFEGLARAAGGWATVHSPDGVLFVTGGAVEGLDNLLGVDLLRVEGDRLTLLGADALGLFALDGDPAQGFPGGRRRLLTPGPAGAFDAARVSAPSLVHTLGGPRLYYVGRDADAQHALGEAAWPCPAPCLTGDPCNGLDDDCSGGADDTCSPCGHLGASCCDGAAGGCDPDAECFEGLCVLRCLPAGVPDICGNGRNDDCDDQVDEGCCVPTREICNGADDDCDGVADNNCCTPIAETCNAADDDCDDRIDEDIDLSSDPLNCGACGNACPQPEPGTRAEAACLPTGCGLRCDEGTGDADGLVGNGCEADATPDVCDGEDTDFDGAVDEALDVDRYIGIPCEAGLGICTVESRTACIEDAPRCDTAVPLGAALEHEDCNEVDDDCDGAADEDIGEAVAARAVAAGRNPVLGRNPVTARDPVLRRSDAGYLLAWIAAAAGEGPVWAQRLDATGRPLGVPRPVGQSADRLALASTAQGHTLLAVAGEQVYRIDLTADGELIERRALPSFVPFANDQSITPGPAGLAMHGSTAASAGPPARPATTAVVVFRPGEDGSAPSPFSQPFGPEGVALDVRVTGSDAGYLAAAHDGQRTWLLLLDATGRPIRTQSLTMQRLFSITSSGRGFLVGGQVDNDLRVWTVTAEATDRSAPAGIGFILGGVQGHRFHGAIEKLHALVTLEVEPDEPLQVLHTQLNWNGYPEVNPVDVVPPDHDVEPDVHSVRVPQGDMVYAWRNRVDGLIYVGRSALPPSPSPRVPGHACATPQPFTWVRVPAGAFVQRADAVERTFTYGAFDLSRTEVTVGQYAACVDAGACTPPPEAAAECTWHAVPRDEAAPINCVSFAQAEAFARFVGGRLPSLTEWQAASGAARGQPHPWGEASAACTRSVHEGCADRPALPCSTPAGASPEGVCDLYGNLAEWVADDEAQLWERPSDGRPALLSRPSALTVGGSYADGPAGPSVDAPGTPRSRSGFLATTGFRVARSPTATQVELALAAGPLETPPGQAEAHRTAELLEVPLVVGGYLDDDVLAAVTLSGQVLDRSVYADGRAFEAVVMGDGAAPLPTPGPFGPGTAQQFAGTGHQADGDAALDLADFDFTLSFWVRAHDADSTRAVFGTRPDAAEPAGVRVDLLAGSGAPSLQLHDAAGLCARIDATTAVTDGLWHHVAFVRHAGLLRVVVDGSVDGPSVALDRACDVSTGGQALVLGAAVADGGEPGLVGDLADVVVTRRPLSPLELRLMQPLRRPWGTPVPAGAQPDFDDLRVTRDGQAIPFEVLGARPLGDRLDDVPGDALYLTLDDDGLAYDRGTPTQHQRSGNAAASTGRFGEPNGAVAVLNGGRVVAGADRAWRLGARFTLEVWVRAGTAAGLQALLVGSVPAAGGAEQGVGLVLTAEGNPRLFVAAPGGGLPAGIEVDGPRSLNDERWHHVAGVRDGDRFALYVDGLPVATATDGAVPTDVDAGAPWQLGAVARAGGLDWVMGVGWLDEAVVHGRALSADALYKRAHPLPRARFLVGTEPPAAPGEQATYPPYRVAWGNADAWPAPTRVDDLLSARTDVVGWWRPDAWPPQVIDLSTARQHGAFAPAAQGASAADQHPDLGPAWRFAPNGAGVIVPDVPAVDLDRGSLTLEARFAAPDAGPPDVAAPIASIGRFGTGPLFEIGWAQGQLTGRIGNATLTVDGAPAAPRHAALWVERGGGGPTTRLALDRDLAAAASVAVGPEGVAEALPLCIGCRPGIQVPVNVTAQAIGEVRVSDRALPAERLLPAAPTRLLGFPAAP